MKVHIYEFEQRSPKDLTLIKHETLQQELTTIGTLIVRMVIGSANSMGKEGIDVQREKSLIQVSNTDLEGVVFFTPFEIMVFIAPDSVLYEDAENGEIDNIKRYVKKARREIVDNINKQLEEVGIDSTKSPDEILEDLLKKIDKKDQMDLIASLLDKNIQGQA